MTYDGDGYLTQVQGPLSGSSDITTMSYDGFGRVYQVTDSEGYTLTYSYDDMDRVTQVTYMDGTTNGIIYDRLDPVMVTDRIGRCTKALMTLWTSSFIKSIRWEEKLSIHGALVAPCTR